MKGPVGTIILDKRPERRQPLLKGTIQATLLDKRTCRSNSL
jgi:hypothetical protein